MRTEFRHSSRRTAVVGIALALVLALAACSSGNSNRNGSGHGSGGGQGPVSVAADGETSVDSGVLQQELDALPKATLADSEIAGLLRMREEELLAHDTYVALGAVWGLKTFDNISSAELTHAAAVKALLDRYSLEDPAAAHVAGVFTDPGIQALYDDLVAQGSRSLIDALTVGATIEDLDIADLRSLATPAPDVDLVYANLEKGSRNHLRAFTKQLDRNGATYTPVHISQADYDSIIAGSMEQGQG